MHTPAMLHLFGKPYIEGDGRPLGAPPASAFLIAALLVLKFQGPADRSELAAILRENADPKGASGYLRTQILRARVWEGEHGLALFTAEGRSLRRAETDLPSDLERFLAIDAITTAAQLDGLLATYRGDFLAGADADGAELREWILVQRTRLRARFVRLALEGARRVGGASAERALVRVSDEAPFSEEVLQARLDQSQDTLELPRDSAPPRRPVARVVREPAGGRAPETGGTDSPGSVVPRVALMLPLAGHQSFTPMQRALADGVVEDVTINLCRLKAVATIAPHTIRNLRRNDPESRITLEGLDYVVETRLLAPRRPADDILLTMSLNRTRTGEMVWATEVGVSMASGPATQGELSAMLATTLVDAVAEAELRTAVSPTSGNAYHHYLLGRRSLRSLDLVSIRRARAALRRSKAIAGSFAPTSSLLARTLSLEWVLLGRNENELLLEAERLAKEAVDLDPFDASGHRELGRAALFLYGPGASLEHYFTAERIAPHHADILADSADTLVHHSDIALAGERMDLALALNPIPPDEYRWTAGAISFFRGDYQGGLQMLRAMRQPEPASRLMAACAAMAGDRRATERYREQALSLHPDFTIDEWMRVMPQRSREHRELYVEALRLAGFK